MAISSTQVLQIGKLIEERIGITVQSQLRGAIDEVLMSLSNGDIDAYIETLADKSETAPVWQELVAALSIGETYFLRDEAHFRVLRGEILPELIRCRREEGKHTINIWSVGCATGEEPYSLAITLAELLPDIDQWTIRLIGTDLNGKALHVARRGIYRKWAFRHTDLEFQNRYFDPTPTGLQIKPSIQQLVSFQHANLLKPRALPQFDLILCRHVLLYFSDEQTRQAENLFYQTLSPGGWIMLGQSELLHHDLERWSTPPFTGLPVYRKPLVPRPKHSTPRHNPLLGKHLATAEFQAIMVDTYEEAVSALHREEYDEAEEMLINLKEAQPRHAPTHVLLASLYANRHNTLEAHRFLDRALELDPLQADAYYLRALLFMEEGENNSAHQALTAALYCQRRHPLASFMLGNIHAKSGNIRRATRYWENAQSAVHSLRPDSPVSDISDITAGHLNILVEEQLNGWQR